jgi:hypothetical protein
MIFCLDFDGTLVEQGPYDATTPLVLLPGAREALLSLKAADHLLVLWSARANLALREDPMLDPLVRAGAKRLNRAQWERSKEVHRARYQQMITFVDAELPGIFDAIDDGRAGKLEADLYVDNRALRYGFGLDAVGWSAIAARYGAPVYGDVS